MRHLVAVARRYEELQLLFQRMRDVRSFAAAARLWFVRTSLNSILSVIPDVRRQSNKLRVFAIWSSMTANASMHVTYNTSAMHKCFPSFS